MRERNRQRIAVAAAALVVETTNVRTETSLRGSSRDTRLRLVPPRQFLEGRDRR